MTPEELVGATPNDEPSALAPLAERTLRDDPYAEIEARSYTERMAALVQVQRLLNSIEATPEELMERIPDLALSVVRATGAVFELIQGDGLILRSGSAAAVALNAIGLRLPLRGSLSGEAIRLGTTLRCDDARSDPRVAAEACRRFGLRSVIATVVRDKAGPVGVLKLFDFQPARFGSAEADSLELLAEALGAVIQRKRAEQAMQRTLRVQAGIVALQQEVASSSGGLQRALDLIAERAQELTGAEGASIADQDGEDLVVLAACGIAAGRLGARLKRAGSLAGVSLTRGEVLCCDDSEIDPRVDRAACRAMGVRSVLIAPLRTGGATGVGALRVMSSRPHAFSAADVGSLTILAEWLGAVMQRDAAAAELSRSESQYRLLFAEHPLPMWVYEIGTLRFLAVNDSAVAQYGYSKQEFLTMTLRDMRSPEGNALLDEYLRTRAVSGKSIVSWQHRRKDGSIVDVESSDSTIDFGGRPARLVLAQDITERMRAERRIQKSEALLNIAGRAAQVGGWSLDRRDGAFSWSDEIGAIHDLPQGSACTVEQALAFYAPEGRDRMFAAVQACRSEGVPYDLELEVITALGRRIWVRTVGQAVRDAAGAVIGAQGAVQDITEQKRVQEEVRSLAARLTTTLGSITDAFYTLDREWRFTYVNVEAERMLGRRRADLMGRAIWEALPHLLGTEFEREYRDTMASGSAVTLETYYPPWQMWLEVHAYPSEVGLAVHFRDVSERHLAQEALHSLNENLEANVARRTIELELTNVALASKEEEIRSVVEHMADGLITFADDGIVRSANSKVEAIFGHVPSALVGRHVSILVPALAELFAPGKEMPPADEAELVIARIGREAPGRHRNGDSIALDLAFSNYRIPGQRLWTAIVRDIGERVRIMADLEQARNGAEEASRAKSAFVANMSHEIRTPMNGVIGMIDVLCQTELAPEQARMLGVARDSAHSLLEIIEDILDFSKIEAGKVELERLPVSVASVVTKVVDLVAGMAAGKGVELRVETDPGLPGAVWADAGRLRQVLVNLLGNAIKFSAGRAGAKVSVRAILSERVADRVNLQLEVEDNGIGMDAATVERLFAPFSQADASTTRRFGGTGLGLAITHHLVNLMGGYIDVRSERDRGAVFIVHLPFFVAPSGVPAVDAEVAAARVALKAVPGSRPAARRLTSDKLVLVAEDNEFNQQVIAAQLRHLGFRAEVASDGRAALALWRSGRFAILLTDLQMPEMDGYELAATIRTEEAGASRMPIVALTANVLKEEADHCKAVGMDGYLTKPVRVTALNETLSLWLGSPPSAETRAAAPALP
jgi:PAS domain S-box-containing protein